MCHGPKGGGFTGIERKKIEKSKIYGKAIKSRERISENLSGLVWLFAVGQPGKKKSCGLKRVLKGFTVHEIFKAFIGDSSGQENQRDTYRTADYQNYLCLYYFYFSLQFCLPLYLPYAQSGGNGGFDEANAGQGLERNL